MQKLYRLLIWLLASLGASSLYAEGELDLKDPFGFRFFILPPDYKTPLLNEIESEKLKWLFLEDLLVSQPERTAQILISQQEPSITPLLGSIGAGYLTYRLTQKCADYFGVNGRICKGISWWYACMAFFRCAVYQQITPDQQRKVQLSNTMKIWPEIRDRLPEQVWPALDSLHTCLLTNNAHRYQSMVDTTLKSIDATLEAHAKTTNKELIEIVGEENR